MRLRKRGGKGLALTAAEYGFHYAIMKAHGKACLCAVPMPTDPRKVTAHAASRRRETIHTGQKLRELSRRAVEPRKLIMKTRGFAKL